MRNLTREYDIGVGKIETIIENVKNKLTDLSKNFEINGWNVDISKDGVILRVEGFDK